MLPPEPKHTPTNPHSPPHYIPTIQHPIPPRNTSKSANPSTPTTPTHPSQDPNQDPRRNLAHKPALGMNHLPGHPPAILGHQPRN